MDIELVIAELRIQLWKRDVLADAAPMLMGTTGSKRRKGKVPSGIVVGCGKVTDGAF